MIFISEYANIYLCSGRYFFIEKNKCPVEDFLDSSPEDLKLKIIFVFKLIETERVLSKKFFKKLSGTNFYEIRIEWKSNIYRFPCFFEKNKLIVLTHGFQKKTEKTPRKEILIAEQYYNDYKRRF